MLNGKQIRECELNGYLFLIILILDCFHITNCLDTEVLADGSSVEILRICIRIISVLLVINYHMANYILYTNKNSL